ncbi:hypothetical protein QUB63_10005 [Microcoleus sp. ARI1-B5]|uniref:hypothetical protein n=1 Tax=unclassified Microcoleus TaxID=2642155 RepID=UPI002FD50419
MTRFIHDLFAKEYLEELLSPIGTVDIVQLTVDLGQLTWDSKRATSTGQEEDWSNE